MSVSDQLVYTPNTCQVPNVIIDYWMYHLSDTQFKVLMVITRKTLGWWKIRDNISSAQIEKLTGFSDRAVRKAVIELERLKLITVIANTSEKLCLPNTYQLNIIEVQKSSTPERSDTTPPERSDTTPPNGGSPTKSKTKPTSQKALSKDDDKTLPFHSEKGGGGQRTKFPLKKEQAIYFEQMKALDLGIEDEKIIIKIRDAFKKGKVKQLEDAISHIREEITKGTKFKKERIALFTQVFNGKVAPISENVVKNRAMAEALKDKLNWSALEIRDKYVKCIKCEKEISLDKEPKAFHPELKDLYELSKIYN